MKSPGVCTGALGALPANGDRTALITVDTRRDTGSAGLGVTTVDACAGPFTAGAAVEGTCTAVTAATGRVKSRLLSRTVGSATSALIAAGFGLVFFDVLPDAG